LGGLAQVESIVSLAFKAYTAQRFENDTRLLRLFKIHPFDYSCHHLQNYFPPNPHYKLVATEIEFAQALERIGEH
jgi:hypothetical protein